MVFFINNNYQIPCRPCRNLRSLTLYCELGSISCPRLNLKFINGHFTGHTLAITCTAYVIFVNDRSLPLTCGAHNCALLNKSSHLPGHHFHATPVAIWASDRWVPRLAASAITYAAQHIPAIPNGFRGAFKQLFQSHMQFDNHVFTAAWLPALSTKTTSLKAWEASTKKLIEDIHWVTMKASCTSGAPFQTCLSKLVIYSPLLPITENLISMRNLLELRFCFSIALILIRVVLHSQLPVGSFDVTI
mmetsp:Transcript_29602/g.50275  ORF Transcript_29602/g.50275 Transcript_29602/m.50275 type:complete len:246 (-) Transcript_29602:162-899(-)